MSYQNQKKYFENLRRYERKLEAKEKQKYSMLLKRHKDDEYLDKASFEWLKDLHEKYHINRPKPNYDNFFKKTQDNN